MNTKQKIIFTEIELHEILATHITMGWIMEHEGEYCVRGKSAQTGLVEDINEHLIFLALRDNYGYHHDFTYEKDNNNRSFLVSKETSC